MSAPLMRLQPFYCSVAAVYALLILSIIFVSTTTHAFQPAAIHLHTCNDNINSKSYYRRIRPLRDSENTEQSNIQQLLSDNNIIDYDNLMVMDVVIFKRNNTPEEKLELGAVQENGNIAPLSTWTLESAYANMMEFVVDEENLYPGLSSEEATVLKLIEGIDYGSRQVGGGKGPGNPHGEESELLYYLERDVVEATYSVEDEKVTIEIEINTDLEHTW